MRTISQRVEDLVYWTRTSYLRSVTYCQACTGSTNFTLPKQDKILPEPALCT
jgi:hypothetical protein